MDDGFAMGYAMGQDSGGGNRGNCNDGGFGGANSWIWIIVVFALLFGWGRNGNQDGGGNSGNGGGDSMAAYIPYLAGGFNASSALTRADLCQDMNFQEVKNGVAGVSDAVSLGFANLNSTICQQQYDTAQMINGLNTTLLQGFNAANVVALQNQNATQAQIADCCCGLQRSLDGINYNMATNTCAIQNTLNTNTRDIIDATNSGTRAILDYLCQEKIADLQSENQGLRLAASQTAQNQYLISQLRPFPVAAYQVCNPFTGTYGGYQGYGSGCGCNSGCGC